MSKSRLQDLLGLATVPRWSVVPTLRPQSVAEHSFNVAAIALELAERLNLHGITRMNIVMWSILHDGPECETGDIPYTLKRELPPHILDTLEKVICPWYNPLVITPEEMMIIKISDKVEEILFLSRWGNGPKADAAMKMAKRLADERIMEARSRFGWSDLHQQVDDLVRSLARFSYDSEQPPSPGPPSPPPPAPSPVR